MMNSRELSALLLGTACGVVASMLLTPRPGREYRGQIRDTVKDKMQPLRDRASDVVQQVERKRHQIGEALEAGRQAYHRRPQVDSLAEPA